MEKCVVCPNCEAFIGDIGNLDICPVCGRNLVGDSVEDNNE